MTELRASLLKWEQLEPARVWRDVHGLLVVQVGKRSTSHLTQPGLLLAAVIEAIEARGWEWTIWSDGAEREATVHIQDDDPKQPRRNYGTDLTTIPTDAALLAAYVAALEAEAGQ